MLGLLRKKKPYRAQAAALYQQILSHSQSVALYTRYGVPDTFTGRFDCLILLTFLVYHRLLEGVQEGGQKDDGFSQTLFDVLFDNMDLALRELGAGDMSVPKHMRRMMLAHNGRVHAYEEVLKSEDGLKEALRRNLYGTLSDDEIDAEKIDAMAAYVHECVEYLSGQGAEALRGGHIEWPAFKK